MKNNPDQFYQEQYLNGGDKKWKSQFYQMESGNYSTKRLEEEAEKRGHEVKVIKYKNCYVSIEQGKTSLLQR